MEIIVRNSSSTAHFGVDTVATVHRVSHSPTFRYGKVHWLNESVYPQWDSSCISIFRFGDGLPMADVACTHVWWGVRKLSEHHEVCSYSPLQSDSTECLWADVRKTYWFTAFSEISHSAQNVNSPDAKATTSSIHRVSNVDCIREHMRAWGNFRFVISSFSFGSALTRSQSVFLMS